MNIEEEFFTDFNKQIKELEKQYKFYERMMNLEALDTMRAHEALQTIKEKLSVVKRKQREVKKLRKKFMAQQASEKSGEFNQNQNSYSKKHKQVHSSQKGIKQKEKL